LFKKVLSPHNTSRKLNELQLFQKSDFAAAITKGDIALYKKRLLKSDRKN